MIEKCPKCGEMSYLAGHRCSPTWDVARVNSFEDANDAPEWEQVTAHEAEDAAKKLAEQLHDEGEEPDYDWKMLVRPCGDTDALVHMFSVTVETSYDYYASEE